MLNAYRELHPGIVGSGIVQLNQSADTHPLMSRPNGVMHCLLHNCDLQWSDALSQPRWLTGLETLCLMGFPVHPAQVRDVPLCSFNIPATRSGSTERAQAGNSMHVTNVGIMMLAHYASDTLSNEVNVPAANAPSADWRSFLFGLVSHADP